jgi:YegS/Rv2252/BmrU family lipid kinase
VLEGAGWIVDVFDGDNREDLSHVISEAVNNEYQAVFVVGGDGTVGQVASQLVGTETALGVLPAGTANVWAQELGLPRLDWIHLFALEQAAARLALGGFRYVDVGECNGHCFLLWAGIGLDAEVVNSVEPRERWEKPFATVQYTITTLWNSLGWDGVYLSASSDSASCEGKYLVAVACNIPAYAGGLMDLAPGAKVDDGLLDFWLIEGASVRDVVYRVIQIFRGTHVDAPGVTHFQAHDAVFESNTAVVMQFDGEPKVLQPPLQFKVHRKALRVLVPADGGPRLFSASSAPVHAQD